MDKEIELVIFDCDGTLVDSEPISTRVIVDMIQQYGLHLQPEESRSLFTGTSLKNIFNYLESSWVMVTQAAFN